MASISDSSTRANIRIEIQNDLSESMELDACDYNKELSEGELDDEDDTEMDDNPTSTEAQATKKPPNTNAISIRFENQWRNSEGGFTTGIDIFGKEAQEKLQTRAQRFGLDPNESIGMTDEQLQDIHDSLGITGDVQNDTRFEAIHMYGTQEMSTQNVLAYFGKYGPSVVEWINDDSCNVVWLDTTSAARALHGLSRSIEGMPITGNCDPFKKTDLLKEKNDSSSNKGRSVMLVQRSGEVNVSDIEIPVPPGYWRLGEAHPKAKWILLRFAKRSDKKPVKAEKFSEYYKKYGNPNYGGMKGLISESRKRKLKGRPVDDFDDVEEKLDADTTNTTIEKGNPWGSLAKNWDRETKRERSPQSTAPVVAVKPSKNLIERLGNVPQKQNTSDSHSDSDDNNTTSKKSKVPRMRMYADEEEARIKKMKQLKHIRVLEQMVSTNNQNKVPDLRSRLGGRHKESVDNWNKERQRMRVEIKQEQEEIDIDNATTNNQLAKQKSQVSVVVRRQQQKPTVQSTVWSRLDKKQGEEQRQKKYSESSSSDSESGSNSEDDHSDGSETRAQETQCKPVSERPGFSKANLKSRLGLKDSDHKSPLRIEINNDHYKK